MIHLILLIFAFVLALIEAFAGSPPTFPRFPHLGWLAVSLFFLALILGAGSGVGLR